MWRRSTISLICLFALTVSVVGGVCLIRWPPESAELTLIDRLAAAGFDSHGDQENLIGWVAVRLPAREAQLEPVFECQNAEGIVLKYTSLTDQQMSVLLTFNKLRYLDVRGTRVTQAAIIEAHRIRPYLSIRSDFEDSGFDGVMQSDSPLYLQRYPPAE